VCAGDPVFIALEAAHGSECTTAPSDRTGQEVHDLENDVLVVFATACPEIGPKVLELPDARAA
jgi:hypothetical protein